MAQKYAAFLFPVLPCIFLSGVIVGVLSQSGMLTAMVNALTAIVPSVLGPYLHLIIAALATPLMFLFTNDTWYYVLIPLIGTYSAQFGVPMTAVAAALFFNFGAMVSVVAQPQIYIALELSDTPLSDHLKFTIPRLVAMNLIVVLAGIILGVFLS